MSDVMEKIGCRKMVRMSGSMKNLAVEIEQADLIQAHAGTIHVQFGDGSVGWIKQRHVNTEKDED